MEHSAVRFPRRSFERSTGPHPVPLADLFVSDAATMGPVRSVVLSFHFLGFRNATSRSNFGSIACGLYARSRSRSLGDLLHTRLPPKAAECALTIVGGGREAWSVWRRGRWKTVCARGCHRALLCGP